MILYLFTCLLKCYNPLTCNILSSQLIITKGAYLQKILLDDYPSFGSIDPGFFISVSKKALSKAQLTQGIQNFDSFSIFSLKQKLQQVLKS